MGGIPLRWLCWPSSECAHLVTTGMEPVYDGIGLVHDFFNAVALKERAGTLGLFGIMVMFFVLVALASAFVVSLKTPWMRISVRVVGSWIVSSGLVLQS